MTKILHSRAELVIKIAELLEQDKITIKDIKQLFNSRIKLKFQKEALKNKRDKGNV